MRPSVLALSSLLCSLALNLGGCAHNEKVKLTETGAPDYDRLHVVYDVQTDEQNVRLDRPACVQQVSDSSETMNNIGLPEPCLRLEIQYPAADAPEGFAHVTLRVLSTGGYSGPTTEGMEEMLVIDVPKPEVDAVLFALARAGFFDHDPVTALQSHVEVTYNRGQVAKSWSRDPKLDEFVAMVRSYGTPIAIPITKPERRDVFKEPIMRPSRSSSTFRLYRQKQKFVQPIEEADSET